MTLVSKSLRRFAPVKTDSFGTLGRGFFLILGLLLWLKMAEARGDGLLRLHGAILLLGPANTAFLAVTMPTETLTLLPVADQSQTFSWDTKFPSISRDGKIVGCVRLKSVDPQREAAAIYSIPDKKWTEYAEAEYIAAVSISPDGSKLAFTSGQRMVPIRLNVIDLVTGQQRSLPPPQPAGALSWSPDGTRLAYDFYQGEFGTRPAVSILEIETGKTLKIADGEGSSWSPSGEWIAYFDVAETSCMKVRPDGSGASTVATVHRDFFGWPGKFILAPVWSPDSRKLLLNATWNVDGPSDILLFDIAKQKLRKAKRGGMPVLGWVEAK